MALSIPEGLGYDAFRFNPGIDSLENVSGAFGGDLDPTKGMYWAWHSGDINFKLEGHSAGCGSRDNAFQLRLGGYQAPHASLQTIHLAVAQGPRLPIRVDLAASTASARS